MTSSAVCVNETHFSQSLYTGKERDVESGNDYFGARYYSSAVGRFLSPDWSAKEEPVPYAKLDSPQSLNLYSYVMNNPMTRADPDGHAWQPDRGDTNCAGNNSNAASGCDGHTTADQMKADRKAEAAQQQKPAPKPHISKRDKAYLDKYYKPMVAKAKAYGVDPALPLGLGIESGFATKGTYLRTGDAFGMTGGSTKHMTHASSPEQNVDELFSGWGEQMRGTGSNVSLFLNHLEMEDANGNQITSQGMYNSVEIPPTAWKSFITSGINEMQRDIPIYNSQ